MVNEKYIQAYDCNIDKDHNIFCLVYTSALAFDRAEHHGASAGIFRDLSGGRPLSGTSCIPSGWGGWRKKWKVQNYIKNISK